VYFSAILPRVYRSLSSPEHRPLGLLCSFKSFNPFTSNSFRTLAEQWSAATPVFSDACGLFPLQWGYIPLYPERFSRKAPSSSTAAPPISSISHRPSLFSSTAYKMLLPQLVCFDNDPFSWGVYTPPRLFSVRTPQTGAKPVATPLL
jgi:hypothetical protein